MTQHMIQTVVGSLAVRDEGQGPVAVLWHSLFVDERSWFRVEADLGVGRRLVLITGPGHGRSGDPGRRYTMSECAAAGVSVLDALGIDAPVDWVGNAWGGHVGVIFAATNPERCRTLVTIGTPVHGYPRMERAQVRLLVLAYRLMGPARVLRDGVTDALLSPRTRERDPAAVTLVRECFTNANRAAYANAVTSISLHREDLTPYLPRIEAPTLCVTGADHPDWTPARAEAASHALRDGSWAVVDGASYLVPLEAPERLGELVGAFWERTRGGAGGGTET
jgi:pimeloyl-ACP methyl ester carboxylesterase